MLYCAAKPLIFALDPEVAHHLSLAALRAAGSLRGAGRPAPGRPVQILGLTFPNGVGLAAGFDKNAEAIDGLSAMGFGHIEVGTVTPRAQPGNPKPRLFRLPEHRAIINRMGFNNDGVEALLANVSASDYARRGGILGINIGKNADTPIESAASDYLIGLTRVYAHASYVTVNISSPNTKNLRDLQRDDVLDDLLGQLKAAQERLADTHGRYTPLVLKIAPDLDQMQIGAIADLLRKHRMDAVIATNTTISRAGIEGARHADEAGGLSGQPVFEKGTAIVRELARRLGDEVPIIAAGGILSGATAQAKIDAGAKLVQVYSGLIYRGPSLVREVASVLARPPGDCTAPSALS